MTKGDESAFLVAIEGIDGSGKGTQAARLQQRLTDAGVKAELLSFPRYADTLFGKTVGDFLNGRFGQLDEVNPFLVSLLYAGDRFESRELLREAIAGNEVVICDRYVPSNIAHQAAKVTGEEQAELTEWIQKIEYDIFQLPRPELIVLLDIPVDKAQELVALKRPRNYTDKQADLQEADTEYLQNVRQVYRDLAATDSNWQTVDAVNEGRLRSIDEIAEDVFQLVEAKCRRLAS